MLMFKERRPAIRTLRGCAISVLQEAGAIRDARSTAGRRTAQRANGPSKSAAGIRQPARLRRRPSPKSAMFWNLSATRARSARRLAARPPSRRRLSSVKEKRSLPPRRSTSRQELDSPQRIQFKPLNSRRTSVMASPSSRRATKRRRSSITELAFHGINTSRRTKAESLTHVSGRFCHLCLGPLSSHCIRSFKRATTQ